MQIHITRQGCCRGCSDCGGERLNCHQTPCICTVAGMIEKLQREAELFDDCFNHEDYPDVDFFPGQTMLEAIAVIEKLKSQVAELLPYMEQHMRQGLLLGPPPNGHEDDCEDCRWYKESVKLAERWDGGEWQHG